MFKIFLALFFVIFSFEIKAKNNNDNWIGEPFSGFAQTKSVSSKKFMVSSANKMASEAGLEILKKGGSAIDAAIATQLVLNVVEPHSSGIGGGGFLLYFDAKNKNTLYFNGRETAPKKAFEDMFLDENKNPRKFQDVVRGGLSVATPGLLKILSEAHKEYGKLPFEELFLTAIKIAKEGFLVDQRMHNLSQYTSYLKDFDETAEIYLDENKNLKPVGQKIYNPKMAKTLEFIAKNGIDDFYKGKIAKDIVYAVNNSKINPGYLSIDDLKNYKSKKGDLICAKYRKYNVCSMPLPSSGGVGILQILGILENFNLSKMKPNSWQFIHLFSEASKLAYADRNEYLADVADAPISLMLDKNYLKKRSELIDFRTAKQYLPGEFLQNEKFPAKKMAKSDAQEFPSTTHISVVDCDGNAVSLTSSIEYFFGSAISVDGFMLNNQLTDFSFVAKIDGKKVANRIEPLKQPRSSMSPVFVFDENDKLLMVLGSPGGPRIIQFVAKTIVNYLDFKMDIQEAISSPNFVALNNVLELENGTKILALKKDLQKTGHIVEFRDIVSGINAIVVEGTVLKGGADARRQGFVAGI